MLQYFASQDLMSILVNRLDKPLVIELLELVLSCFTDPNQDLKRTGTLLLIKMFFYLFNINGSLHIDGYHRLNKLLDVGLT